MRGSDYTTHLFTSPWFVVVIGFLTVIIKQRAQHFFILCCALSETKGINYKSLKSQCVIPGQEHLPELVIMSDPLNTFDVMEW